MLAFNVFTLIRKGGGGGLEKITNNERSTRTARTKLIENQKYGRCKVLQGWSRKVCHRKFWRHSSNQNYNEPLLWVSILMDYCMKHEQKSLFLGQTFPGISLYGGTGVVFIHEKKKKNYNNNNNMHIQLTND